MSNEPDEPDGRERAVAHTEEYREHYIRLRVYRYGNDAGSDKEAVVSVHKNRPRTGPLSIAFVERDRSAIEEWTVDIPAYDSEDVLTDALEQAKAFVDDRRTDAYGARESATIAVERAFADEQDREDTDG